MLKNLSSDTFPCFSYAISHINTQEELYQFAKVFFTVCDMEGIGADKASLVFLSFKTQTLGTGSALKFNDFHGETCPPQSFYEKVMQDASIALPEVKNKRRDLCRTYINLVDEDILRGGNEKPAKLNVCAICPHSGVCKNRAVHSELILARAMLSDKDAFLALAEWAKVGRGRMNFRSCVDISADTGASFPTVVPLLPEIIAALMTLGENSFKDDSIGLAERFEKARQGAILSIKEKYLPSKLHGADMLVGNAMSQLQRDIEAAGGADSLDIEAEKERIRAAYPARGTKAKKAEREIKPVKTLPLLDILMSAEQENNSEEKASVSANGEGHGAGNDYPEGVSDDALETLPADDKASDAEQPLKNLSSGPQGVHSLDEIPGIESFYLPTLSEDIEIPEFPTAISEKRHVFESIVDSGVMPVELVNYRGDVYILLYDKPDHSFFRLAGKDFSEASLLLFSKKSIVKICWQPYYLYSIFKMIDCALNNVWSIFSMNLCLDGPDMSADRDSVIRYYSELIRRHRGKNLLSYHDKVLTGMARYVLIYAVQLKSLSSVPSVVKNTLLRDEVLGRSFLRSINVREDSCLFYLNKYGDILYSTEPFQTSFKKDGVLLSYHLGSAPKDVAPSKLFMKALMHLAGKGIFRKYSVQLLIMDEVTGVMQLYCADGSWVLVKNELQLYLHMFAYRNGYKEFNLVVESEPFSVNGMDGDTELSYPKTIREALLSFITVDQTLNVKAERIKLGSEG